MTFEEYQKQSRTTAIYPELNSNIWYPTLGLAGEAGEVAEKVKKVMRDKGGMVDDESKSSIAKELGDVMWYISQLATELGLSLEDIVQGNLKKLQARKKKGNLHGSGDDR